MWAQLKVLSGLFVNLSAGFFGLVFITPIPVTDVFLVIKNLALGLIFYWLAVKLEKETNL